MQGVACLPITPENVKANFPMNGTAGEKFFGPKEGSLFSFGLNWQFLDALASLEPTQVIKVSLQ